MLKLTNISHLGVLCAFTNFELPNISKPFPPNSQVLSIQDVIPQLNRDNG